MIEKKVNFYPPLPGLVLSGIKDTTWRIGDDKDLTPGDILILTTPEHNEPKELITYPSRIEFAKAKVIWTKETTFGELTLEDKVGHEPFSSDEEMYKTYSGYYHIDVNPSTRLKVIKFRLIN